MAVIATFSVKGGVGKTTTAINLAWEAAQDGRVLVWDLDPQGAATWLLQAKPKLKGSAEALVQGKTNPTKAIRSTAFDGIDVLPADDSYRDLELALDAAKKSRKRVEKVLAPLLQDYDTVILDVPPGSSVLAENVLRAADIVVVPVVPGALARRSLEQVNALLRTKKDSPKVVALLSMLDKRKSAHKAVVEEFAHDPSVTDIAIPYNAAVERVGERRAPIATFAPRTAAARQYRVLWNHISSLS